MKKYTLLIVSLFLLTGCALTRDHISLNYDPMVDVQKIPEAENIQEIIPLFSSPKNNRVLM